MCWEGGNVFNSTNDGGGNSYSAWIPRYLPSRNILHCPGRDPSFPYSSVWWGYDPQYAVWWTSYRIMASTSYMPPNNHARLNGENVVFLDGHGEWRTSAQVKQRFSVSGGAVWVYW